MIEAKVIAQENISAGPGRAGHTRGGPTEGSRPAASSPLNPTLFDALQREFGQVRLANPGQPASGDGWGEYYCVDCPYCGDTKQRLWVNHRFATDNGGSGDNLHLVTCYNESCINTRSRQEELRNRLFPFSYGLPISGVGPPTTGPPRTGVPAPPSGESETVWIPRGTPLGEAQAEPGRQYLLGRDFDPNEISQLYGVDYCSHLLNPSIELIDCLIIPIESCQTLLGSAQPRFGAAGWQARRLRPGPTEPKYYSMPGMRVKQHLYGMLEAVNSVGPLVIVEGVTDVWRLGPNGVATFGKSMSRRQQELLVRHAGERPIVVMYDPDALAEGQKVADSLRRLRRDHQLHGRVVAALPPDGCEDVGDSTREAAWDQVHAALRNEISFAPVSRSIDASPTEIKKLETTWEEVF